MPSKFCITDLYPEVLAPKVTRAREKMGWTIAELAREASVQFASVARVEKSNEEPGVLTSLNVALAAKVVELGDLQPEAAAIHFASLLGSDLESAAVVFQQLAEEFLCGSLDGRERVPSNLFHLYNASPKLAQLVLVNPEAELRTSVRRKNLSLDSIATPLPLALGVISSECISLSRRHARSSQSEKVSIPSSEVTFWRHLSANRTVNVGARRLVDSLHVIAELMEAQEILTRKEYLNFATKAFVNYYLLEQAYEVHGKPEPMPDFWKLMYDFVRMRQDLASRS
jgi:transcriptional regulator with XRE-family HTH domain